MCWKSSLAQTQYRIIYSAHVHSFAEIRRAYKCKSVVFLSEWVKHPSSKEGCETERSQRCAKKLLQTLQNWAIGLCQWPNWRWEKATISTTNMGQSWMCLAMNSKPWTAAWCEKRSHRDEGRVGESDFQQFLLFRGSNRSRKTNYLSWHRKTQWRISLMCIVSERLAAATAWRKKAPDTITGAMPRKEREPFESRKASHPKWNSRMDDASREGLHVSYDGRANSHAERSCWLVSATQEPTKTPHSLGSRKGTLTKLSWKWTFMQMCSLKCCIVLCRAVDEITTLACSLEP